MLGLAGFLSFMNETRGPYCVYIFVVCVILFVPHILCLMFNFCFVVAYTLDFVCVCVCVCVVIR